ncbi:MarR family transcriptional regulator [uncultured Sphingomonas sp.]|uniref:MarR family winged helix-turn-helix transcriptional regulator n=1 Tax=uncultured Sphingomonas sp. TaxID=158754 RepID=UPI0026300DBD|nr:MarR family transcriptional regulator [uncultured Sphingomonas sp.]
MSSNAPDSTAIVQRRLGSLLIQFARRYRRHLDRELTDLPVSQTGGLAVMMLGRMDDGVRQGVLAEKLGVEAPTIVPLIDDMERGGLVRREVDPADRRARKVHLTEAGRDMAVLAEVRVAQVREELFDGIAPSDLQIALDVLERLQARVDDLERRDDPVC